MTKWKALAARITLLTPPSGAALPSALEIYRRLWTDEPDNFQRSTNPLLPSQAQGKRDGFMVACTVAPNRIDFNMGPVSPLEELARPTLQLIEDTQQLHTELRRIAISLGKTPAAESSMRVAVAVQFVSPSDNLLEANKKIVDMIPKQYRVTLSDEESFALQLSRPVASQSNQNAKINVVTRWSVDQIQVMTFAMASQAVPQMPIPQTQTFYAASVNIDCNTAPSNLLFAAEQQSSLLLEGLTLASEAQRNYGLNVEGF